MKNESNKKQQKNTASDILAALKPLFDEYFIGRAVLSEESLVYFSPNGKKFRINVQEL